MPSPAAPPPPSPYVVRGAILDRYLQLGGSDAGIGRPVSDEIPTPRRPGAYQLFEQAAVYWSPATGAWEVGGRIRDNWVGLGNEDSALGFPRSTENSLPGSSRFQVFEGGLSYYSPATGAHEVRGAILDAYARLGWEGSRLGYPVTNELTAPDGLGRYEVFERGSIYWTPITGAHAVEAGVREKWAALGWERSPLSYPLTNTYPVPDGRHNDFLLGSITASKTHGTYVSRFLAAVSSVDRARGAFTVDRLEQTFRYDDNDTYLRLVLSTDGTSQTRITRRQFTDALGVDTIVVGRRYTPDAASKAEFAVVDAASVAGLGPQDRARLLDEQPGSS